MVTNRGNALAYTAATGHRPLPRADEKTYRNTHRPQQAKAPTFDWDWNKATCSGCATKTPKSQLVDDQCPTCRGVQPVRAVRVQSPKPHRLEHSKDGGQVYETLDDHDLAARYEPPSTTATEREAPAEPEPPGRAAPAVEEPTGPELAPSALTHTDLLQLQVDHTTATLTRAHGHTDPLVGLLRTAALSAIAALDIYLDLHHPLAAPATAPQPTARFQTFEKPRGRGGRPRATVTPEVIADVVRRYQDEQQSLATVMADTGMGKVVIRRILTEAGVTIRPSAARPTQLTADDEQAVVDAYLTGRSSLGVGRAFHIHARTVRDLVRTAGHQVHDSHANGAAIGVRLRDLGVTARQVKDWAVANGVLPGIARGTVAHAVIDAYEAAHQTGDPE